MRQFGAEWIVRCSVAVALCAVAACGSGDVGASGDAIRIATLESLELNAPSRLQRIIAPRRAEPSGLTVRLRDAEVDDTRPPPAPLDPGEPLSPDRADALLERLPALEAATADTSPFEIRPGTPLPPRTGDTIRVSFPPTSTKPLPTLEPDGPLRVVRHGPEGEVPVARNLSITFSEPMIAVGDLQTTDRTNPARIDPQPGGRWRWLGTRPLVFQPSTRFPAATTYRVEIPAGTRAASGNTLDEAVRFEFSTPPPQVVETYPGGNSVELEPLVFIAFDQRIDPETIAEHMSLRGQADRPLVLVEPDRLELDAALQRRIDRAEPGRWLLLRPATALPPGTKFELAVRQGAPSAEGPRTTSKTQRFDFSTYQALRIERHRCGWGDACSPSRSWSIQFNNLLDTDQRHELEIDPPLDQQRIETRGSQIMISGLMKAKTAYRVAVPAETRDQFGQTLGKQVVLDFETAAAERRLTGPQRRVITLDPFRPPTLPVFSTNNAELSLRILRVEPEAWPDFMTWSKRRLRPDSFEPSKVLFDDWIEVNDEDRIAEASIDLAPYLVHARGHLVVWIETRDRLVSRKHRLETEADQPAGERRRSSRLAGSELLYWVQGTELALTSIIDSQSVSTWVTRLRDGTSVDGARVELLPAIAPPATTDEDGLAQQSLHEPTSRDPILITRTNNDSAILVQTGMRRLPRDARRPRLLWYHTDDRGLYRPGESIRLKGWVRRIEPKKESFPELPGSQVQRIAWVMNDPRGRKLAAGETDLTSLGGFDLIAKIPEDSELGQATIQLRVSGSTHLSKSLEHHGFMIQEFRRPEFEVETEFGEDSYLLGDTAIATTTARYYAGGSLSNSPLHWTVTAEPGHYVPPNHDDFRFGIFRPWWFDHAGSTRRSDLGQWVSRTDAAGNHALAIELDTMDPIRPTVVRASAGVEDRNRQVWLDEDQVLVHPAAWYVGLRTSQPFIRVGEALEVESVVVGHEGERVENVDIRMSVREAQGFFPSRSQPGSDDPVLGRCSARSRREPISCRFEFARGGRYEILAAITDEQARSNETRLSVWVAGGEQPSIGGTDPEIARLIPDREDYAPGDTAEILLTAPFYPAHGLLTIAANGILRTERFEVVEATQTLPIRISEQDIPGVHAWVELVGQIQASSQDAADSKTRVAHAHGSIALAVPPQSRTLELELEPAATSLSPGDESHLTLRVLDHRSRPVEGAEVMVAMVDEALLALGGHDLADPLAAFYPERQAGIRSLRQRAGITSVANIEATGVPQRVMMSNRAQDLSLAESSMSGRAGRPQADPIRIRKDTSALAFWSPVITTDGEGRASISFRLPDSVTRYRVMAVAAAGARDFGKSESQIVARLPLTVRPSPPRFANFGDRFELPILVQNQTDDPMTVDIVVRANHGVFESDASSAGRRIQVPENDRVEVRFRTSPTTAGRARFQVAVEGNAFVDAAEFDIPVWTPATHEAFATYGVIDDGAVAQPIAPPREAWPQFGGLEITTSSTRLQALSDAMIYLNTYAFECNEQIASRMISVIALDGVLEAFDVGNLPTPVQLKTRVREDVATLASLQNSDGGFGFWRRGERSWPWITIHVAHALHRARAEGIQVSPVDLAALAAYLADIDQKIDEHASVRVRNTIRAYALSVRNLAGDFDLAQARRLAREDELPVEAIGWLLPILKKGGATADFDRLERRLLNRVSETAAGAQFTSRYSDGAHLILHSERRADGVVLGALIDVDPDSDLVTKLVHALLAHRKQGRWNNTQENVFILLALSQYFERFEGTTPDFVSRIWLGEGFAGEHAFEGRTTDRVRLDVPMASLAEQPSPTALVFDKRGQGRLYYRVGLRYAPRSLQLDALDNGFAVVREYQAVDRPGDVTRAPDGTWRIKPGARVRVIVSMASSMRRHHVAMVDPLPAGLEVIRTEDATNLQPLTPKPHALGFPRIAWHWYEHENLRDDRVEAFTSSLNAGAYTYTYTARATTPGAFVVPPARAEEMYQPETFGRSRSARVLIE